MTRRKILTLDINGYVVNYRDMRWPRGLNTDHIPPYAVIAALYTFNSTKAEEWLTQLRYHPGDDNWSFTLHGMFVGVERDGYIHT